MSGNDDIHFRPSADFLSRKNAQIHSRGGKVPPQVVEMEMAVLGVLLSDRQSLDKVAHILAPEKFFKEPHKMIYSSILDLSSEKSQDDLHLVINDLRSKGQLEEVGGHMFLAGLITKYARKGNLEKYAVLIAEKYMLREIIKVSDAVASLAFNEDADPFDLLENGIKGFKGLEPAASMMEDAEDLAFQAMMDVDAVVRGETKPIYIGFEDIDSEYAFDGGDLVLLGGKSGTGKTGMMMQIAKRMRKRYPSIPVIFNSLEMKGKKIISRDMASTIGVSNMRFRTGKGVDQYTFEAMQKVIPLYKGIHFFQCWTNEQLGVKVRMVKKSLGLPEDAMVVVMSDYAQIMKGEKGGNREQEVSSISRGAKQLAEQENLIYFLGSQINKEAGKGRPTKSNLRESEALANDADWVVLLYNPSKNDERTYEDGSSTDNILEAIFDKVRFGKDGEVIKLHMSNYGLIGDLSARGSGNPNQMDLPVIKPKDITIPNSERMRDSEEKGDFFPF